MSLATRRTLALACAQFALFARLALTDVCNFGLHSSSAPFENALFLLLRTAVMSFTILSTISSAVVSVGIRVSYPLIVNVSWSKMTPSARTYTGRPLTENVQNGRKRLVD